MTKPKVSVIIPVYNESKYIKNCIRNCTSQTMDDIEIIVVDDKSTDDTREKVIAECQRDNRVKLIPLKENRKQGFARSKS